MKLDNAGISSAANSAGKSLVEEPTSQAEQEFINDNVEKFSFLNY